MYSIFIDKIQYPISILYRFIIAFLLGYACTYLFTKILTDLLSLVLPKAESIYLAAFIGILFLLGFVITSFCIQSIRKLTISGVLCSAVLFIIFKFVG